MRVGRLQAGPNVGVLSTMLSEPRSIAQDGPFPNWSKEDQVANTRSAYFALCAQSASTPDPSLQLKFRAERSTTGQWPPPSASLYGNGYPRDEVSQSPGNSTKASGATSVVSYRL